jgi:hypothetical protein
VTTPNCRHRISAARFPVDKTLAGFDLAESAIPRASDDHLITLDSIRRADTSASSDPPAVTAPGSPTAPPADRRT